MKTAAVEAVLCCFFSSSTISFSSFLKCRLSVSFASVWLSHLLRLHLGWNIHNMQSLISCLEVFHMLLLRWRASLNKMSLGLCSTHGLVSPVSSDHCHHSSKRQAMTRETNVPNCSVVPLHIGMREVHFCLVIYLFSHTVLVNCHFSQRALLRRYFLDIFPC